MERKCYLASYPCVRHNALRIHMSKEIETWGGYYLVNFFGDKFIVNSKW